MMISTRGLDRPRNMQRAHVVSVERGMCTLDNGITFNVAAYWRSGHGDAELPRAGDLVAFSGAHPIEHVFRVSQP
jgi:hypothetical protein